MNAQPDAGDNAAVVRDKANAVREMFGRIAGRYDFLNHVLSANIDRRWRRTCLEAVMQRVAIASPRILDVGCGTADLALEFSGSGRVTGCDFCQPMLHIAAEKVAGRGVMLLGADALSLPFADTSFDVVISAFVLRNLVDIDRGFAEMRRVLRPGGVMAVLDFGMPETPVMKILYRWYFLKVLPRVGKAISGVDGPYAYLPSSVQSFPPAEELRRRAERAGFAEVQCRRLTGGVAVLVLGNA